jgi:hypothetical protein
MLADIPRILFALGLPFLTGGLFILACWPSRLLPGYRLVVAGMAFPLGMVGVIAGYILFEWLGIGLQFSWNVAFQAILAAGFGLTAWWRWRSVENTLAWSRGDDWFELPGWAKALVVGVLAWVGLRWVGIVVEVVQRPLFPWDAWYAYGNQAKVWFYEKQFDSIVGLRQWLRADTPKWSSGGTRHPPGIGLSQLWFAQSLGRWDDALMNIGWPGVGLSLGLFTAGTIRLIGGHILVAVGTAALLLTLPILDTQMALAGYGDLWIGSFLAVAVGCVALSRKFAQAGLLLLALAAVVGMLSYKQTAQAWVPVLGLGALAGWVRLRWIALAGLLGLGLGVFSLWWLQETVSLSTLGSFGFNVGGLVWPQEITMETWRDLVMWSELLRHLLVYPNWHLLWYLMPFLFVASWLVGWSDRAVLLQAVALWTGLAVLIGVFALTSLGNAVVNGSSVNRLVLHFVPGIVLLMGWVLAQRYPAPDVRGDPS